MEGVFILIFFVLLFCIGQLHRRTRGLYRRLEEQEQRIGTIMVILDKLHPGINRKGK